MNLFNGRGNTAYTMSYVLRYIGFNNSMILQNKKLKIQKTRGREDKLYQTETIRPTVHHRTSPVQSLGLVGVSCLVSEQSSAVKFTDSPSRNLLNLLNMYYSVGTSRCVNCHLLPSPEQVCHTDALPAQAAELRPVLNQPKVYTVVQFSALKSSKVQLSVLRYGAV